LFVVLSRGFDFIFLCTSQERLRNNLFCGTLDLSSISYPPVRSIKIFAAAAAAAADAAVAAFRVKNPPRATDEESGERFE